MANKRSSTRRNKSDAKGSMISYVHTFDGGLSRPNKKMTVPAHQEVGRRLQAVWNATPNRAGVHNRVNAVRAELDEWLMREYPADELDSDTFSGVYYRAYPSRPAPETFEMVRSLERVKEILGQHYPNCRPLRALLERIDKAIASLRAWTAKTVEQIDGTFDFVPALTDAIQPRIRAEG